MKRRLLIVAVFLLAGAVVNVAVAWGCAAWNPPVVDSNWQAAQTTFDGEWLWLARMHSPGLTRLWFVSITGSEQPGGTLVVAEEHLFPSWAVRSSPGPLNPHPDVLDEAIWVASGWPARSMYCEFEKVEGVVWTTAIKLGGIELSPSRHLPPARARSDWRALPLRPIWPGFAVNTIFYAAVLWLLIPGSFVLRRIIRIRRGLCPACAYPRGESDLCSECGKALS